MLKKRENHSSQRDPKAKDRKMVILEIDLEKDLKLRKIKKNRSNRKRQVQDDTEQKKIVR